LPDRPLLVEAPRRRPRQRDFGVIDTTTDHVTDDPAGRFDNSACEYDYAARVDNSPIGEHHYTRHRQHVSSACESGDAAGKFGACG
jgi:hypothetical protein